MQRYWPWRVRALPGLGQEVFLGEHRKAAIQGEQAPLICPHNLDGQDRRGTGRDGSIEQASLRVRDHGTEVIIAQFIQQR